MLLIRQSVLQLLLSTDITRRYIARTSDGGGASIHKLQVTENFIYSLELWYVCVPAFTSQGNQYQRRQRTEHFERFSSDVDYTAVTA